MSKWGCGPKFKQHYYIVLNSKYLILCLKIVNNTLTRGMLASSECLHRWRSNIYPDLSTKLFKNAGSGCYGRCNVSHKDGQIDAEI